MIKKIVVYLLTHKIMLDRQMRIARSICHEIFKRDLEALDHWRWDEIWVSVDLVGLEREKFLLFQRGQQRHPTFPVLLVRGVSDCKRRLPFLFHVFLFK